MTATPTTTCALTITTNYYYYYNDQSHSLFPGVPPPSKKTCKMAPHGAQGDHTQQTMRCGILLGVPFATGVAAGDDDEGNASVLT